MGTGQAIGPGIKTDKNHVINKNNCGYAFLLVILLTDSHHQIEDSLSTEHSL